MGNDSAVLNDNQNNTDISCNIDNNNVLESQNAEDDAKNIENVVVDTKNIE